MKQLLLSCLVLLDGSLRNSNKDHVRPSSNSKADMRGHFRTGETSPSFSLITTVNVVQM